LAYISERAVVTLFSKTLAMILSTDRVIDFFLRVDDLIRNQTTGTAAELGCKLSLSKRSVYRLMGQLKRLNLPIDYSRQRKSYFYLRMGRRHIGVKPIAPKLENREPRPTHRQVMVLEAE